MTCEKTLVEWGWTVHPNNSFTCKSPLGQLYVYKQGHNGLWAGECIWTTVAKDAPNAIVAARAAMDFLQMRVTQFMEFSSSKGWSEWNK